MKFVAATIGDFNWDGTLELLVAFGSDKGIDIQLVRYHLDGSNLERCAYQSLPNTGLDGNPGYGRWFL